MPAPAPVAPPPLIDAEDLARRLAGTRPPVVLDVRWRLGGPSTLADYEAGHVPTARWVDLDRDLAGPPGNGRGRHPLPEASDLEATLRRLGARDGDAIVVYDDAGGTSAARAWWLLRWAGISDVRVLDGGIGAWTASGGPLVPGRAVAPAVGNVTVRPNRLPTVDANAAARLAREGVLLDARAAERYRGEVEPMDPVAGHIPGARNAPTTANVAEDGRLAAPDDLRRRFAAVGVDGTKPVAVYCGSGVTAAHEILALAVAGIDAFLYPGSWSEWVSDPARPVATGPEPG
ncbi:MAG TPA: sulfurtransferase [Acidimicrobiales bacterium]|nr:sulfurtransferase [Acidimicrobiales bacterium]